MYIDIDCKINARPPTVHNCEGQVLKANLWRNLRASKCDVGFGLGISRWNECRWKFTWTGIDQGWWQLSDVIHGPQSVTSDVICLLIHIAELCAGTVERGRLRTQITSRKEERLSFDLFLYAIPILLLV